MEEGKFFRATTLVVIAMLVFILASIEGCGALIAFVGPPITGTVVDAGTKLPVAGALVVLEQADASGTDRIVASTTSASDGTFSLDPPSPGNFDVVADATVQFPSGLISTYAATVTFGVPANSKLTQIPLVPQFGGATPNGTPVAVSAIVFSSGPGIVQREVDVTLSALQSVSPAVGSVNQVTIPALGDSTTSITTLPDPSCASGTACANYHLLIPSGNFSAGTFSGSGTHYNLLLQQPGDVNYTVEGRASVHGAALSSDCMPSSMSAEISIVSGLLTSGSPDLSFSGCL